MFLAGLDEKVYNGSVEDDKQKRNRGQRTSRLESRLTQRSRWKVTNLAVEHMPDPTTAPARLVPAAMSLVVSELNLPTGVIMYAYDPRIGSVQKLHPAEVYPL